MVGEAHFYTTEIAGELVLFDTGPATAEALACLEREVELSRLSFLFVTHCHVDHYGLAAHIAAHSGARVLIPRQDAVKLARHDERIAHLEAILCDCGFDAAFCRELRALFDRNRVFPTVPQRFDIVEESDIPRQLGIDWLACPGHSQSDLVYRIGRHAVTGDVLLRNVFQAPLLDVDLATFSGRFENYTAYCTSLLQLATLRGAEIRPGHRGYVTSLDETILFYVQKLLERAVQVRKCPQEMSVREVIGSLFGASCADPFFVYLKASEIVFMRDFLARPELLREALTAIGLFEAVSARYAAAVA